MKLEDVYPDYSAPHAGGDKGTEHSYIPIYSKHVPQTTRSILEVGVWEGHSLAMWQAYLPHARVTGMDITDRRLKFDVDCLVGNATSREDVDRLIGFDIFDVIIDDGSHKVDDQIRTFDLLWPRLAKGGRFFIEDVAGTRERQKLEQVFESRNLFYTVWDLRHVKDRFDDILIMVEK